MAKQTKAVKKPRKTQGAREGSERWKIEQLRKKESLVLLDRPSNSVTGTLFRAGLTGRFSVRVATIVMQGGDTLRGSIVTRLR